MDADDAWRPRLASCARLKFDPIEKQVMLLFPEAALALNETGAAIVQLCNGARSISEIVDRLSEKYGNADRDALMREVVDFIATIRARGLLQ
ncbi:MAG: pyrroloquinoline quinone biosynthesis peptide chaperone PqqD [Candidatus Binatus sp.]|jgi:pyrroloquinoline quinone biosynthesis protein D|uniref:pyrroloquinoline quinone biosynthesis peptide chaperone PqqD n=1 Tax=Candidatus Binatus sp. TaxID=2811406 RepID=UPI003C787B97